MDKIRVRAENRVEKALVADLKRVRGKHGLLFALDGAAVEHPDETVRGRCIQCLGTTRRELVKEAKASELLFRQRVRKEIRGSYSHHAYEMCREAGESTITAAITDVAIRRNQGLRQPSASRS